MVSTAEMESLHKLKMQVLKEIEKIVAKGDITKAELENAKEAVEVIEKVNHIERGQEPDGASEYSQRGYHIDMWPRGNSYNSYMDYRNSYDNYGARNMNMGGYSRAGGDKEYMIRNLEMAMNEASSDEERRMISDCINRLAK